ncbi:hypothetical protein JCM5296_007102 [Sporobolomyces johnsonii]
MKAWVFHQKGQPADVLKLVEPYPKPEPKGDQVLVKVHAVALNPVSWKAMTVAPIKWMQKTPAIPESDLSGVIEAGDLTASDLHVGDAVFGFKPADQVIRSGMGALAEYTLVDKKFLSKKPDNITFEEAASMPLTTYTAFHALVTLAGLQKGEAKKIFINGGSGGVGAYAVQIAKAYGADVTTTCSPESAELVNSLGADKVLDYKASPLPQQLEGLVYEDKKPFDIILDTVGIPELYHKCPKYLAKGGLYLDLVVPHNTQGSPAEIVFAVFTMCARLARPTWLGGVPRKYKFVAMRPKAEHRDEMVEFLKAGTLRPIVDEVFPFEDALKAYERSQSGRAKGKVVVTVVRSA